MTTTKNYSQGAALLAGASNHLTCMRRRRSLKCFPEQRSLPGAGSGRLGWPQARAAQTHAQSVAPRGRTVWPQPVERAPGRR